jgi:hypothetical protein
MIDRRCPHCATPSQARLSRQARLPHAGDVSVCSRCFGWSVYGHDIDGVFLRSPTPAEVRYWQNDPGLIELLVAMQIHPDPREAVAWWEATTVA